MESTASNILAAFLFIIFIGLLHMEDEVEEGCSKYFCSNATQKSNCSLLWDECLCIDSVKMKCNNLYFKPFGYDLSGVKYGHKFSLIYEDISLNKIVQVYGRKVAANGLISMVSLTKRCNSDKAIFLDTVPLDIKKFTVQSNIFVLSLQRNCLKELDGVFGEYFPKLQELDFSKNAIEKVDERILDGLQKMENLNIGYNKLLNITRRMFQDLKSLKELNLCHNDIRNLTADVFYDLVHLKQLSICNNKGFMNIPVTLFIRNTMLVLLNLNGNSLQQLPANVFLNLNHLKKLNLENNQLILISKKLFLNIPLLRNVYLSSNKLKDIPKNLFSTNKYLAEIDMSQNEFNYLPQMYLNTNEVKIFLRKCNISSFCVLPTINSGKPLTLIMSNNCIQSINITSTPHRTKFSNVVCSSCCLSDVPYNLLQSITSDEIDLSYNEISKINLFNILNVVEGNVLNLNHNKILTINMSGITLNDFRSESSVNLRFRSNPFNCDCNLDTLVQYFNDVEMLNETEQGRIGFSLDEDAVCVQPEKLRDKKLTDLKLTDLTCALNDHCPSLCRCQYEVETRAVVVNCSGLRMDEFPDLDNITDSLIVHLEKNKISNLPGKKSDFWKHIRELYLGNNKIHSLDNITISSELRKLYLEGNELTKFQTVLLDLLSSNRNIQLKLADNSWDCCSVGEAKRYILKNNTRVIDANDLICMVNKVGGTYPIRLINATDEDLCLVTKVPETGLKIGLSCLAVFSLILSIAILILCRFKEELKVWMFTHDICLNLVTEEDIDVNKKYDAFVSYSSEDDEWVLDVLVPGLEQGTPSYTLCLHQRDWLGGEWITDQIVRSVEESRRTILVLTKNFVESHWSKMEFIAAYHQMVKDNVKRIIIIVPFDLPDLSHVDEDLRVFVSMNTYIKWDHEHFWRKLRCSMPCIKKQRTKIENQKLVEETSM